VKYLRKAIIADGLIPLTEKPQSKVGLKSVVKDGTSIKAENSWEMRACKELHTRLYLTHLICDCCHTLSCSPSCFGFYCWYWNEY